MPFKKIETLRARKNEKKSAPAAFEKCGLPGAVARSRARSAVRARARFSAFLCTTATPLAGRPDEAVLRSPASPVCALHPLGNVALCRWSGAVAALQQGAECVPRCAHGAWSGGGKSTPRTRTGAAAVVGERALLLFRSVDACFPAVCAPAVRRALVRVVRSS